MSRAPLNTGSGMPQMGPAFAGWASVVTVYKRNQVVSDALVTYGEPSQWDQPQQQFDVPGQTFDTPIPPVTKIVFNGVVQPLSPKLIALKPEGQRAWDWLQIHCFSGSLNLDVNDQIIYNQKDYKVMGVNDYTLDNFIEYHVIRDYQDPPVPTADDPDQPPPDAPMDEGEDE